jgi:hypothetical protein
MPSSLVWLGISAIYLRRRERWHVLASGVGRSGRPPVLAVCLSYATALGLGGAVLILAMPDWWVPACLLLVAAGLAVALAGMHDQAGFPELVARASAAATAGAMALAACGG